MLEEVIKECLKDLKDKKINKRMQTYNCLGNPYAILKDEVVVCIRKKKDGCLIEINVTDLVKNLL